MAAYARTPSALMWLHANHLMVYTNRLVVKTVYTPLIRTLRYDMKIVWEMFNCVYVEQYYIQSV